MTLVWVLNALALATGALLGARGFIDPHWAAKLVRLKADEQGGGFAEFRATYGGVFLGMHAVAFVLSVRWLLAGGALVGVTAAGASAAVAASWAGAAIGRAASMWRDKTDTKFNRLSLEIEIVMALAIASPWLAWLAGVQPSY